MNIIFSKILQTSGAKIVVLASSIVSLILTSRLLGPEGRGILASMNTWSSLVFTLIYLSLGQVVIHRSTMLKPQLWLTKALGSLTAYTILASITSWIAFIAVYYTFGGTAFGNLNPIYLFVGLLSVPLLVWEQYGSSILIAIDKLNIYNIAQITSKLVGLFFLILFLYFGFGVLGASISLIGSQILLVAICLAALLREIDAPLCFDSNFLWELIIDGLKLHPNAIGTMLFGSFNIIILQRHVTMDQVGIFQLALQLALLIQIIPQSAASVFYSKVAEVGPREAWKIQRGTIFPLFFIVIALSLLFFFLAPYLVTLVAGRQFFPAVEIFQLLLLSLIGTTMSAVMAPQWIGRGLFWQASILTFCLGIFNVLSCALLAPVWGIKGAAISTAMTYILTFASNLVFAFFCNRDIASISDNPLES